MIFRLIATVKVLLGVVAILFPWTVSAAPANDSFAERIELVGTNVNFTVTLAGANASTGGYGAVWWEWMAISNGIVDINPTLPVALDAWMTIYRTSSPVTMPTSGEDVFFGELFRSASFVVKVGEVYLIKVTGLASQQQTAQLELSLRFAPANDHFVDRFILPPNSDELSGSVYGASYEYQGVDEAYSGTAWWSWTPNLSGYAAFRHVSANIDYVYLTIWRAGSWEELTETNVVTPVSVQRQSPAYFPITAGQEYAIRMNAGNRTNVTHRFAISTITGPGLLTQPQDQVVRPGGATFFHVFAPEIAHTNVTWQFNGVEIPGAFGLTYPVFNVSATNLGSYRAVVKIGGVPTLSEQASLSMSADVPMSIRISRDPENPEAILFAGEGEPGMYHVLESSSDMVTWEPVSAQFLGEWPKGPWLQSTRSPGSWPLRYLAGAETTAPLYRAFFRTRRAGIFKDACIMNLRRIQLAKEDYRIRNLLGSGTPVHVETVNEYFPESLVPRCPEGGNYTYNALGTPPTCEMPTHAL